MAMMCSALLAARSPPRLSRWRTVFPDDAGTGLTPHSDAKLASRAQSFRIVAGCKEELRSSDVADRIAGDEVRRQLIDDGDDHYIEIRDLVMQFQVTASQGLEPDAIGGIQVAIGGKIGSPRGQGADELHAGKAAQLIAKAVGSADDCVVDHLQGDAPGAHRGLPAGHENPQGFDHAVPASRRHGPLACKGGMGGVLGVEIVVLAASAAILVVGSGDLENCNPCLLHEAQQPCTIATGRFYPDALQVAECAHPGEHLAIALTGGGEAPCSDNPILLIDHRCDVKILMGIDASNNATRSFGYRHSQPPALTITNGFTGTECADRHG
jgi:hypothetical protein